MDSATETAPPPGPAEAVITEIKEACGYDEMDEAGGIEALIDYKNALEERLFFLLEEAEKPGGDGGSR